MFVMPPNRCHPVEELQSEEQQHEVGEKVTFQVTTKGVGPGTLTAVAENVPKKLKTTEAADADKLIHGPHLYSLCLLPPDSVRSSPSASSTMISILWALLSSLHLQFSQMHLCTAQWGRGSCLHRRTIAELLCAVHG